jgi:hypothetical protein
MSRVLIVTAWYPSRTEEAVAYFGGVSALVQSGIPVELFITTALEESKNKSAVRAMSEGEVYAQLSQFTHVLNLEMDKVLPPQALRRGLELDKPVLLFNDKDAPWSRVKGLKQLSYNSLVDGRAGWGSMLVKTGVLDRLSLSNGYVGDYISPGRAWFKRAMQLGIEVWRDSDTFVKTMAPPSALVVAGG